MSAAGRGRQRANEDWERRCAPCQRARGLAERGDDPWAHLADGWVE